MMHHKKTRPMHIISVLSSLLFCLVLLSPATAAGPEKIRLDASVPQKVTLTVGKSAIIVCPDKHLGGLSSGGLGFTDTGDKSVIGGISREFYHRVWAHYQTPEAWKWQKREEYGNRGQGTAAIDGELELGRPHVGPQCNVMENCLLHRMLDALVA